MTLCRAVWYLIDALEVPELAPLGALLESTSPIKVIHNASFERSVLGRHGLSIAAVVDTREVSRRARSSVQGTACATCARGSASKPGTGRGGR